MINPDRPFVFGWEFFALYQERLLWFANTWIGKIIFRIHGKRSSVGSNKITKIYPNAIGWEDEGLHKMEFRSGNKYSKRLFYSFYPVWYLFHLWDTLFANHFYPRLNLGFDTLTVYPDANTETTTVDGYVEETTDAAFSTVRAAAGDSADDSGTAMFAQITSTGTTDVYDYIRRCIVLFDTSSLGAGATVDTAVLSPYVELHPNTFATINNDLYVVSSAPASNTSLAAGDFDSLGSTSFGNVTSASTSDGAYKDITLNNDGEAAISVTGVTKLGFVIGSDFTGIGITWESSKQAYYQISTADVSGTSQDPKLVVTYTPPGSSSVSPSLSPSSSASRSVSPSASASRSASSSASASESRSLSPSSSASASESKSLSPSASESTSLSPSASASRSVSPSTSVSPSPSIGYSNYTRGNYSVLPTNDNDLETIYTEVEETTVSVSDDNRVGQTGSNEYMVHQFKTFVGSRTFCEINLECRSARAPSASTVYLQIYDQSGGAWETLDSNSLSRDALDFTFVKYISDLTNYKTAANTISVRVYQLAS